ncbi:MAG: septation protein A [Hyphomicrobiaceae bacterium]
MGQQFLKLLVEMGPLVVFFTVNAYFGLFYGTATFMVAIVMSLIASKMIFGHIPVMPLVTAAFVLVLGGFTLWLQNEVFIKIKPTIVNTFFAVVLTAGMVTGRALLKYVFGEVFALTEEGWRKLTWRWIGFFLFLALLNEFIWRTQTTDFWVSFKVFGIMPLTLVFGAAQIGLLKRYELKTT